MTCELYLGGDSISASGIFSVCFITEAPIIMHSLNILNGGGGGQCGTCKRKLKGHHLCASYDL